jgi:hypothetical protein
MTRRGSKKPITVGPCERWFKSRGEVCGGKGRYVVYEGRALCKQCYQAFKARPGAVLFDIPPAPTVVERWAFHCRLRRDL